MDDKPTGPPPTSDEGGPKVHPDGERPSKPKKRPPRFAPDPNTPVEADELHCNGRTRAPDHHLCDNQPGFKTDHPGVGRCKFHAGSSRVKTGAYSKVHKRRPRIVDLAKAHADDPDPFNMRRELDMVRALADDGIEHFEETRDALLAWHASWQTGWDGSGAPWRSLQKKIVLAVAALAAGNLEAVRLHQADMQATLERGPAPGAAPRPREVPDIMDLYRVVSEATKIIERQERLKADTAVSRQTMLRVADEMAKAVMLYVTDQDLLDKIRAAWGTIHE